MSIYSDCPVNLGLFDFFLPQSTWNSFSLPYYSENHDREQDFFGKLDLSSWVKGLQQMQFGMKINLILMKYSIKYALAPSIKPRNTQDERRKPLDSWILLGFLKQQLSGPNYLAAELTLSQHALYPSDGSFRTGKSIDKHREAPSCLLTRARWTQRKMLHERIYMALLTSLWITRCLI